MSWDENIKKELGYCGKNVMIGQYCVFTNPSEIILHDNVRIDSHVYVSTKLEVDPYSHICGGVHIIGGKDYRVFLGRWTFIGYGSKLFTSTEDYSGEFGPVNCWNKNNKRFSGDIIFNSYSGVASDVIVMNDIILPKGCLIGAKSLVYKSNDLKEWSIYFGNPLKFHKERNKENCIMFANDITFKK